MPQSHRDNRSSIPSDPQVPAGPGLKRPGWQMPGVIVVSGMDGTGKSTHASRLFEELRGSGIPAVYRRIRFPHMLSAPLLLYARLRKRSYVVRSGEYKVGVHDFESSRILRLAFPLTLFLDLLLAILLLVRVPRALGKTVICDRFVLDTLVDLIASFGWRPQTETKWVDRFRMLVPRGSLTFFLTARPEVLIERRPELAIDPKLGERYASYARLAQREGVASISTERGLDGSFSDIKERIVNWILREGSDPLARERRLSSRWYAYVASGKALPGLRKAAMLAVHWLFQSVLYMNRTERTFKLALTLLLFLSILPFTGTLLGLGYGAVVAAVLAHSINFALNAHIPAALKQVDLAVGTEVIHAYVEGLRSRVSSKEYLRGALAVGSLGRGELASSSDLDVRVVRRSGFTNALRACIFVLRERARALRMVFPLDIYLADPNGSLKSFDETREAVILCDNTGGIPVTEH